MIRRTALAMTVTLILLMIFSVVQRMDEEDSQIHEVKMKYQQELK